MSAGRALFCLTAGAVTLAGGLVAADPACAAKAASAGRAPNPTSASSSPEQASPQKPAAAVQRFDIDDFAVQGAETLPQIEIEEAIYPFLGPNKSADDVEKARAALEKAYHDKGYQTVSVSVPQQNALSRMITLKVAELKVGRLRVKNSRYFDLAKITNKAGSLKEGTVPNFGAVTKDIVALNQWPDRRVTPALRAGVTPGTVDVDLNVEDKAPLHASVEL
ncbi:POTRA domain-containing protein, partial [Bradyrhizobium valentinum]